AGNDRTEILGQQRLDRRRRHGTETDVSDGAGRAPQHLAAHRYGAVSGVDVRTEPDRRAFLSRHHPHLDAPRPPAPPPRGSWPPAPPAAHPAPAPPRRGGRHHAAPVADLEPPEPRVGAARWKEAAQHLGRPAPRPLAEAEVDAARRVPHQAKAGADQLDGAERELAVQERARTRVERTRRHARHRRVAGVEAVDVACAKCQTVIPNVPRELRAADPDRERARAAERPLDGRDGEGEIDRAPLEPPGEKTRGERHRCRDDGEQEKEPTPRGVRPTDGDTPGALVADRLRLAHGPRLLSHADGKRPGTRARSRPLTASVRRATALAEPPRSIPRRDGAPAPPGTACAVHAPPC